MATDKIRVMISSRSSSEVFDPPVRLSELRHQLKTHIESELTLNGFPVFEVWICEDDTGDGVDSWWETSCKEVRQADLLLVLYTGEAGSRVGDLGLGICHAELFEAVKFSREKVLPIVTLGNATLPNRVEDRAFQDYVSEFKRWPNDPVDTDVLLDLCARILGKELVRLTKLAVRRRMGAGFDMGSALDWSKLDFATRKRRIETVLVDFFMAMGGTLVTVPGNGPPTVATATDRTRLLWCVHAIPAATSISAARELVGQPFIDDHLMVPQLNGNRAVGPVHIIGCHKGITESQALKIRGIADCTVVKTDFGIYLADSIQKIQILFLANCRDLTATQAAITEMFHWLEAAAEMPTILKRARSRKNILKAIYREVKSD